MVTIGPTRWFVWFRREAQRGGRTKYDLSLVPEAKKYLIVKLVRDGNASRAVDSDVITQDISVSAWLNTWDATGPEEMRLGKSLSDELAAQAVGEGLRLEFFRPRGIEKYARQLVISQGLLKAIQKPTEEIRQVDEIDVSGELKESLRLAMSHAGVMTEEELAQRAAARLKWIEARKRSLELLFQNMTDEMAEHARSTKRVVVKNGGFSWKIPIKSHGLVEKCLADGKCVAKYCIIFGDEQLPVGDEVLMKMVLIQSDLNAFLAKANMFIPEFGGPDEEEDEY